jgi:hypothetical protein
MDNRVAAKRVELLMDQGDGAEDAAALVVDIMVMRRSGWR